MNTYLEIGGCWMVLALMVQLLRHGRMLKPWAMVLHWLLWPAALMWVLAKEMAKRS